MSVTPQITTKRLQLRLPNPQEAMQAAQYFSENREHLAPSHPRKDEEFYSESFWRQQLQTNIDGFHRGESLCFFIYEKIDYTIIGSIQFSQIVRGPAQFCYLGYGLARAAQGKGYMTEALVAAIEYAFDELHLHRIMANYAVENERSGKLLRKLGFRVEGYARSYLKLNGRWRDHMLTSLINQEQ